MHPKHSFSYLTTILQYYTSFLTTRALFGEGSYSTLVTSRTLQLVTTLAYSLVTCTRCLYYQAARHCGFKIEIAMQPFKPQENGEVPK